MARKPKSRVYTVDDNSDELNDMFIGMIPKFENNYLTQLKKRRVFKMDIGAQCNVISKQKCNQLSQASHHIPN